MGWFKIFTITEISSNYKLSSGKKGKSLGQICPATPQVKKGQKYAGFNKVKVYAKPDISSGSKSEIQSFCKKWFDILKFEVFAKSDISSN